MKLPIVILSLVLLCSCGNRGRAIRPWEIDTPSEECQQDSITDNDTISPSSSKTYGGYSDSYNYESEDYEANEEPKSKYANDGHPGTKPDDGLFGFDPYDDEDDAYDVERNQIDPYPDEW